MLHLRARQKLVTTDDLFRNSADFVAELQRHGREYNHTVSEDLFRRYITADLYGFERKYKAYALKTAELQ